MTLVPLVYLAAVSKDLDDRVAFLDLPVGPQQLFDDPLGRQRCANRSQVGRGDAAGAADLVARGAGKGVEQQGPLAGVALFSRVGRYLLNIRFVVVGCLYPGAHGLAQHVEQYLVGSSGREEGPH